MVLFALVFAVGSALLITVALLPAENAQARSAPPPRGAQADRARPEGVTMHVDYRRAALAGVLGTVVMTGVGDQVVSLMGIPQVNPAEILAGALGDSMLLGWIGHFLIGALLAEVYGALSESLPGPAVVGGAMYALAPWLLAQVVLIPMMGMPVFSGWVGMAMGSLVSHLAYGGVVGGVYGTPVPAPEPLVT